MLSLLGLAPVVAHYRGTSPATAWSSSRGSASTGRPSARAP